MRALRHIEPEALADDSETAPAADFEPLRTAHLSLDPAALSGRWLAHVRLGAVDLTAIQSVAGELRLGAQQRRFLLNQQQTECTIPVWGNTPVDMRAELVTAEREVIAVERTLEPSRPVALINLPADRFHVVEVMLQDPLQRYAAVMVELEIAAESAAPGYSSTQAIQRRAGRWRAAPARRVHSSTGCARLGTTPVWWRRTGKPLLARYSWWAMAMCGSTRSKVFCSAPAKVRAV